MTDFSVVVFRPDFMLASEEYPMKAHKNQWLLTMGIFARPSETVHEADAGGTYCNANGRCRLDFIEHRVHSSLRKTPIER